MAKALFGMGGSSSAGAGGSVFSILNGRFSNTSTENRTTPIFRTAGTLSNLAILIPVNTLSVDSTFAVKINSTNTALIVTLTASTTGVFNDISDVVSVSSGDNVGGSLTKPAGTGSITFGISTVTFNATSNTISRLMGSGSPGSYARNAVAEYHNPNTLDGNITEANRQAKINVAGTLKNLYFRVQSNSRTTSTTFRSRLNGAYGNLSISVSASTTGEFEDTSNTDTISANDLVALELLGGAETTTMTFTPFAVGFENTNGFFVSGGSTTLSQGNTTNRYSYLGGGPNNINNEALVKSRILEAVTFSKLSVYVSTAPTVAATATVRQNGSDTALSVILTALTTGWLEDLTDTVDFVSGDDFDIAISDTTGGTMVTETLSYVGYIAPPAPPASGGEEYTILFN